MHRTLLLAILSFAFAASAVSTAEDVREQVRPIVTQIQRADYEGDRATLREGFDALAPFAHDAELGSRIRYWRGFALWRSAINGFNDNVDPQELDRDLRGAIDEFKAAREKEDHSFVDAKIGMISCLGYLAYMKRGDETALAELLAQISALVAEVKAAAPDNPRLRFVLGPILWYQARQTQSGLGKIFDNYREGLEHCPQLTLGSLEPTWGKPELYMSLALTYLNDTPPDLEAAEENARRALALVPYWHYTRDILLPQIAAAKAKAK